MCKIILDLLVDPGVYALGTAEQMMQGKQYHRAVRGLILSYEVLMQAFILQFSKWVEYDDQIVSQGLGDCMMKTCESYSTEEHRECTDDLLPMIEDLEPLLGEFKEWRISKSKTFKLWMMFLDMVQILLWNIRATRQSDWEMQMSTHGLMLPLMYATNHHNYSCYLPVFILDMIHLPDNVREAVEADELFYKEKEGAFNSVWTDMGVEKTVI